MTDPVRTVEAVWRMESAQLVASLTRIVRDLGLAEEIAADVFVLALEQWPARGVPPNPGAWLMATAKHKAIDRIRREVARDEKYAVIARDLETTVDDEVVAVPDDVLALVFTACHPVLPRESRVALTLRVVAGLRTEEIARAFLAPSATIGQRISRAKRTLAEARVPFEVPQEDELAQRLSAVLEVVYLVFNEGYSASTGDAWVRRDVADEAMRLGRVLAGLMPDQPEVHGLLALMELQASRFASRTDASGWPGAAAGSGPFALGPDPDPARPCRAWTGRSSCAAPGLRTPSRPRSPDVIRASPSFAETDWEAVVSLYDALAQLAPSPVVELNRAVAVLHADGPEAALAALDRIRDDPQLARYHLFGAVRGDVLSRLGRHADAAIALEEAAALAPTRHERSLLLERAAAASALSE